MKNIKRILILFLLITSLIFSGCSQVKKDTVNEDNTKLTNDNKGYSTLITDDYNNLSIEKLNKYVIDVDFNPDEKIYSGKQRVIYVNNDDVTLNEVYFHLYPNAFKNKETAPFLFNDFEGAFPNGFEPGYINISKVSIDNKITDNYSINGTGETILKIPLKKPLKPGDRVEIYMEFKGKLPPSQDRFGYGDKTYNFGNWYPIAAVYDKDGWNLDPYYTIGDPFYSDTSNYEVTINTPKDIMVASSGSILSEKDDNDKKVWKIEALLMRDFAWVGSKYFKIESKEVDGTLVKVYLLGDNEELNNFAKVVSYESIKTFNKLFGKYPFGNYSVVATSFPSGMEYPGIVFIGEKYYNSSLYKGYLETVIVHETAHQWWYSVIGNDEIDESWLDESLTSYSEVIYSKEKYGEDVANRYYEQRTIGSYSSVKGTLKDEIVAKSLKDFESWDDYGPLVYGKGAALVHEIKKKYGEETLYEILSKYYDKYRFLNVSEEDFKKICEEVTGDDIDPLINKWLYNK